MKPLTFTGSPDINATAVPNKFIDRFMPSANGEFVKVYLFLLRHLSGHTPLTLSDIADSLNHTEKDIIRALRYWEAQNLIILSYDGDGQLEKICAGSRPGAASFAQSAAPKELPASSDNRNTLRKSPDKELKSLLFIAEQYLGKTLTKTDTDAIIYFRDSLDMSADLIEYLIETCVENGHKNIHYIQKVALSWHKEGVTTLAQAKMRSACYNKNCYTVLNAFGIKNRGPAASEIAFIRKWSDELGFTTELIKEACDRTIITVHTPSFEYADTILGRWKKDNVHTLDDLKALDEAHLKEKAAQERQKQNKKIKKSPAHGKTSLQQRSYDMDSLEDKLLKNN